MRAPTAVVPHARSAARRTAVAAMALLAAVAVTAAPARAAGRVPDPLNVTGSSAAGEVGSDSGCSSGPLTDGRLFLGSASLAPGQFSSLAAQMGVSLPFRVGAGQAALPEDDTRVVLVNPRGTLTLALKAGTCSSPTLALGGSTVSGTGTWTVVPDSTPANAYRGASGTGSFNVTADVTLGSGRSWSLSLTDSVSLLQPQVAVTHRAYWGGLGNYLSRTLSVEYRIRNTGSGDAFNVKLLDALPTGSGITRLGPVPQTVGSIRSGATASVVVRYRVCGIAVVGCRFTANTQTSLTDALDGNLHTEAVPVTVQVPIAPLP
ncbi:hypothetical protein ACFVHW_26830 [Streptomyces sp. NPDC127110]|uniref:hypothetical protein n=1 Tax=Streptomyces sp. NPDC127110 TaxID=3345362 RepID=UPI003637B2C9